MISWVDMLKEVEGWDQSNPNPGGLSFCIEGETAALAAREQLTVDAERFGFLFTCIQVGDLPMEFMLNGTASQLADFLRSVLAANGHRS